MKNFTDSDDSAAVQLKKAEKTKIQIKFLSLAVDPSLVSPRFNV